MGTIVGAERFVATYQKARGALPPSYYHNSKLVVHGYMPESTQMIYFLSYGEVLGEELPWGKAVYHIPEIRQEDAKRELRRVVGYFPYRLDKRRGQQGRLFGERVTIFSDRPDERGRPIVEAITGPQGRIQRIAYTRRDIVQRLAIPAPSKQILYLAGSKNRTRIVPIQDIMQDI